MCEPWKNKGEAIDRNHLVALLYLGLQEELLLYLQNCREISISGRENRQHKCHKNYSDINVIFVFKILSWLLIPKS